MARKFIVQFTIGKLLFATTLVAVYLGLRSGYVFGSDGDLHAIVARAWWVPWTMAALVSAYVSATRAPITRRRVTILNASLAGGAAAALTAAILGFEIAEGVRREFPAYWNWRTDVVSFLIFVVGRGWLIGTVMGGVIGALWGVAVEYRKQLRMHDAQF